MMARGLITDSDSPAPPLFGGLTNFIKAVTSSKHSLFYPSVIEVAFPEVIQLACSLHFKNKKNFHCTKSLSTCFKRPRVSILAGRSA